MPTKDDWPQFYQDAQNNVGKFNETPDHCWFDQIVQCSQMLKLMVKHMLKVSPSKRCTVKRALQARFLNETVSEPLYKQ